MYWSLQGRGGGYVYILNLEVIFKDLHERFTMVPFGALSVLLANLCSKDKEESSHGSKIL